MQKRPRRHERALLRGFPREAGTPQLTVQALINIDVPDLERVIRFYQEAFGLRLSRKLFGGSVAEMAGASAPIYLIAKPEGSVPIPQSAQGRTYERHWTPVHLDFVVDTSTWRSRRRKEQAPNERKSRKYLRGGVWSR